MVNLFVHESILELFFFSQISCKNQFICGIPCLQLMYIKWKCILTNRMVINLIQEIISSQSMILNQIFFEIMKIKTPSISKWLISISTLCSWFFFLCFFCLFGANRTLVEFVFYLFQCYCFNFICVT